jgi:hypothetical protein
MNNGKEFANVVKSNNISGINKVLKQDFGVSYDDIAQIMRPFVKRISKGANIKEFIIQSNGMLLEDHAVFDGENTIPDFTNKNYSDKLGTYNSVEIYGSRYFGERIDAYGIIDEKTNKTLAFLLINTNPTNIGGVDYYSTAGVWVSPEHRNKGLASTLYLFVTRKMNLKLMSDSGVSSNGLNLYSSFLKRKLLNVKFYNNSTNEIVNTEPSDLFSLPNKWNLIFEKIEDWSNLNGYDIRLNGLGHRQVPEYRRINIPEEFILWS